MKATGSEGRTEAAAGHRVPGAAAGDRPTFSLALTVPIAWEPLAGPPDGEMLDKLERANSGILVTLLKCADLGAPPTEDEALAEALDPLRVKIDMIIEMLARISYRDLVLPEPRPIELGLLHLRWSQSAPLAVGSWLLSRIYFHDLFREPVVLAGRVASSVAHGTAANVDVDLAEMPEPLSESFARLVFLEHRRQLSLKSGRRSPGRPA